MITLGGTFFQEFYGVFTNTYASTVEVQQSALIYVQEASQFNSYIGNEQLPDGPDPFVPPTPPTTNLTWLWILLAAIFGCLIIALGIYYFYRRELKKKQAGKSEYSALEPNQYLNGAVNQSETADRSSEGDV
jgi:hypothetical protein